MRAFLYFVLVFVIINAMMAGIIYMTQLPGEDQQRDNQLDNQLDRIEEKLDTLIEIGEKWQ